MALPFFSHLRTTFWLPLVIPFVFLVFSPAYGLPAKAEPTCVSFVHSLNLERVNEVRSFLEQNLEYVLQAIRERAGTNLSNEKFKLAYLPNEDLFACRLCIWTTEILLPKLAEEFPENKWLLVRTTKEIDRFLHDYIYSPDLDLIIDLTYRQFLKPSKIDLVPRVFVGSPKEFRNLLDDEMYRVFLDTYLSAIPAAL